MFCYVSCFIMFDGLAFVSLRNLLLKTGTLHQWTRKDLLTKQKDVWQNNKEKIHCTPLEVITLLGERYPFGSETPPHCWYDTPEKAGRIDSMPGAITYNCARLAPRWQWIMAWSASSFHTGQLLDAGVGRAGRQMGGQSSERTRISQTRTSAAESAIIECPD